MFDFQAYFFPISICLISTIFLLAFMKPTRVKSNSPPSPFRLPIIGHLHLLSPSPHRAFHRLSQIHGPVFKLFMGCEPCVIACSPETVKEFLKTNDVTFADRPQNSTVVCITYESQDFAFAPYGPHWKSMKKIVMSKLLNTTATDMLLPDRRDEIHRFIKLVSEKAKNGKAVNLEAELMKLTNNLITRTVLGERCSEDDGDAEAIRHLIFEITQVIGAFNLSDNIRAFKRFDVQGYGKHAKDLYRRYDALIERIIKEHEEERKQPIRSERKHLLNILMDIAEDENEELKLNRDNIKSFILNIFVAGTDNSAITVEWALSELINHPHIMKKAIEEIDRVIGKKRLVLESDMPNLPYLRAIIKETLRLHPPVPVIPRKSREDCTVAGFDIEANTTVLINVWSVGRNPNHWENPNEFKPERFIEKQLDMRGQNFELLPFGSGRRMCPGTSLGLQMVHSMLGVVIQCFEWKAGEFGNLTSVDMGEGHGLSLPRANPLICVPVVRYDPVLLDALA